MKMASSWLKGKIAFGNTFLNSSSMLSQFVHKLICTINLQNITTTTTCVYQPNTINPSPVPCRPYIITNHATIAMAAMSGWTVH